MLYDNYFALSICIFFPRIFISFFYVSVDLYGLRGGNAPWFSCWYSVLYKLFVCLLNFFLPYAFFLIYFFTHLLSDLSTPFRIERFHFQAKVCWRRPNLALVFVFILCCSIFCYECMFPFVWFDLVLQYHAYRLPWKNIFENLRPQSWNCDSRGGHNQIAGVATWTFVSCATKPYAATVCWLDIRNGFIHPIGSWTPLIIFRSCVVR